MVSVQTNGKQSRYIEYLPSLYRDDEFMTRFLLIFESVLGPIENMVNNIPYYFDTSLAPEPLLSWLASWLDLALDPRWSLERRRELVNCAVELYRWRGTRKGMREYLRIYTGSTPEITEYIPGMRLDGENRLGKDTVLGSAGTGHHFTVTLKLDEGSQANIEGIRAIIEAQKPAHAAYTLQVCGAVTE